MATANDISERKPIAQDTLRPVPAPSAAAAPRIAPPLQTQSTRENVSGLRITAILLRTAFILILMALVIAVSQPQSETIWSAYETPGDLVRLWLGIGACVWLGWQLFTGGPKDVHCYRTWLYLGLVLVPFSLICLVAIW
jgi:hypothetical protein